MALRRPVRMSKPFENRITRCTLHHMLVDNASIKSRMERWPTGKFKMVRNAKHDVLTETPEVGGDVMGEIVSFFKANSQTT